ncbi:MAG TPA: hypothetical protein DIV86_05295 [Alphaproteobacteria bacterium]|nr:hypothetical protein [Alphaproteobacteria bacterium]
MLSTVENISCQVSSTGLSVCIPTLSVGLNDDDDIFDKYDSYILHFFGAQDIDKETTAELKKTKEESIYIGIAVLLGGLFFTGDIGNSITMIGVMFILAVLVAAMQAVLIFTTITIALNVLMALAPLAVTCILFDPLKKMTNMWFFALIAYAIQPLVLTTFLAITLGLLSGLVNMKRDINGDGQIDADEKMFSGVYDGVKIKMSGEGTSNGKQSFTIIDCEKVKLGASVIAQSLNTASMMGSMASGGFNAGSSLNSALSGGDPSAMADITNQTQGNLTQGCDFMVDQLRMDIEGPSVANAEAASETVTAESIKEMKSTQFAVIMLLVMLITFLKKVPELAEKLTDSGKLGPLTRVAGGVGNKVQEALVGKSGSGGIMGAGTNLVKREIKF